VRGRRRAVLRLVAYLGRYAHQSIGDLNALPLRDIKILAAHTSQFLEEEAPKR